MSAGLGGLHYIPHKAVMYLEREAARAMGEEFKTLLSILTTNK